MKTREKKRLLKDLLNDEDYRAFRAELFERLYLRLQPRRTHNVRRRIIGLAACVPIAIALYFLIAKRTPPADQNPSTVSVVRTVPLPPDQIVSTRAMKAERSAPFSEVVFVSTTTAEIEFVHTAPGLAESLTDDQLLDLFKGQPVALVFVAPNERRLVVLDQSESR